MEKEQLVNGKWYKAFKSQDYYIKYSEDGSDDTLANCSEYIPQRVGWVHSYTGGSCGLIEDLTLVKISEIAKYLPEGHPDLKKLEKGYSIW
jgi:hypothetical protein